MESGLEDRNNLAEKIGLKNLLPVSMESGLEDRNNEVRPCCLLLVSMCLNGVRPRRPEQFALFGVPWLWKKASQWSPA